MDSFDKIIKEKVDQFEAPYNEAHWTEMDSRLNSIKAAKIKNTVMGVAAGVISLAVVSYFIFYNPTNNDATSDVATIVNNNEASLPLNNNTTITPEESEKISFNNVNNSSSEESNTNNEIVTENNDVEKTINNNSSETQTNTSTENKVVKDIKPKAEKEVIANQLSAEFIVYNNQVCVGQEVSFESIESDAPVSYVWNFGDGKVSNKTNPKHKYSNSGVYTVTLTLIDRQTGKEHTTIQNNAVKILPNPKTQFTYLEESKKHDDNKLMYPHTSFAVKNAEKETKYKWIFGNGSKASSASAKTIYQEAGNYSVTLISENSYGCLSSVEKKINVSGVNLYAPNALRVSSDIAENSVFIPKALTEWDIPFEMVINNAAGRTIYKTSDSNEPWNGKINNNGPQVEAGIYFWQVTIVDAYGVKHSYQGKVNLIK